MFLVHKKRLAFTLPLSFASVVYSQFQVAPAPTPLPLPYISYPGQGCAVFREHPTLIYNTCVGFGYITGSDFPEGIIIINQARGADISEAAENWLIIADGSGGPILTLQEPLRLIQNQALVGAVPRSWVKPEEQTPVLSFSVSSPAHLIHVQEAKAVVRNLQLKGVNAGGEGALLYMNKPAFSDISKNLFITTLVKSTGIDINDYQDGDISREFASAECDTVVVGYNAFNLSASSQGVRVSCLRGENQNAIVINNRFNLKGDSRGVHIVAGGLSSEFDKYTQTGPAISQARPPIAILFDSGSQVDDNHLYYRSLIECDIFNGGSYGELVPVSLAGFSGGDETGHNQVTIAYNTFQNVPEAVRVGDNASQTITANSICNIWINDDSDDITARCPETLPNNGFLHFEDGVTCGTKPANFVEPDCVEKRRYICGSRNLVKRPTKPQTMEPTYLSSQGTEPVKVMPPLPQDSSGTAFSRGINTAGVVLMTIVTLFMGYF